MDDRWQSVIDQQIQKAIRDGQMSNLPGEGKRLDLDENPYEPAEMRMANKILRENDLAPEWILAGRELEEKREQLLNAMKRASGDYKKLRIAADASLAKSAERAWQVKCAKFQETAAQINKLISAYNLKVPSGVTHKHIINVEREIERLLNETR